jgi:predicted nucleotide-binding protein (sugar kinase/HSP70/actin superfamily)
MSSVNNHLIGRDLYIPRMSIDGASAMAAVFRSFGVNGQLVPESDEYSLDLAKQYTIGEECYPEIVTLGGFLKLINQIDFNPEKVAFMMPTAGGPCRFGQYAGLLKKILNNKGLDQVIVVAPSSENGYDKLIPEANNFVRMAWWGLVCADILRKLLLQTRPYEINSGDSDRTHAFCLDMLCKVLERTDMNSKVKFAALIEAMKKITYIFSQISANYSKEKLLIGIVGEIYCRLDDFSNAYTIKRIEKYGGEVWLASIAEWIFYVNFMQKTDLKIDGRRFSKSMLNVIIKNIIQTRDEHQLYMMAHERFIGYEEPENTRKILEPVRKYLPYTGALGEMVLNVGGAIYLHGKGADGIIDISPFTCMNGIVCEAIYPNVSKDHDNIPIKNFYFDGTGTDFDRDVEIFMELAANYKRRKKVNRTYPSYFS